MTSGGNNKRCRTAISGSLLLIWLAGCQMDGLSSVLPKTDGSTEMVEVSAPAEVKYHPSDEPLRLGSENFARGQYGIAERYFRDAVEKEPNNATAWIGLAACYDELRRFDLAA